MPSHDARRPSVKQPAVKQPAANQPAENQTRFELWGPWLLAAAAYLCMAAVFAWPLPAHLNDAVWGDRFDAWTTLWLMGHLGQGGGMGLTTEILFPIGYEMWSFGHVGVQLLGLPLIAMGLSVTTTYNLLILASLAGSGLAGHALGRHLSGGHWGGLVAGSLFAFCPMLYGEMGAGCLELVAAFTLPLVLLAALRLLDKPTWQRAAWLCAALLLAGPLNWYYLAFSALLLVGLGSWRVTQGGQTRWSGLGWMAGACALAMALLSPLILKARQETPSRPPLDSQVLTVQAAQDAQAVSDGTRPLMELDEPALLLADSVQVLVNSTTLKSWSELGFPSNPLESTPGLLAVAMGIWGLWAAGKRGRPWALLALAFCILTLGPYPRWNADLPMAQWSQTWPLPYLALYNELPFFSKVYRPYRLGLVAVLCLSALAATGLGRRPKSWMLAPVLALLACTQPHWRAAPAQGESRRSLASTAVSSAYMELAELPPGAVIELPLHHQPLSTLVARQQFAQLTHGKPLLNCNQLIRRTDLWRFRSYIGEHAWLEQVLGRPRRTDPLQIAPQDWQDLYHQGFRYIVAHPGVPVDPAHLGKRDGQRDDLLLEPMWSLLDSLEPLIDAGDTRVYGIPEQVVQRDLGTWTELPEHETLTLSGIPQTLSENEVSMWLHGSAALEIDGQLQPLEQGSWWHLSIPPGAELTGSGTFVLHGVQALSSSDERSLTPGRAGPEPTR
ncbi:MAG: hypothetical protein ACI9VR_000314 [Cognaticolwellia sp.]|jgi:hypothetical protein